MKYQLLFIAFLFAFIDVKSQFITSTDTVLCSGEDVTLVASGQILVHHLSILMIFILI